MLEFIVSVEEPSSYSCEEYKVEAIVTDRRLGKHQDPQESKSNSGPVIKYVIDFLKVYCR